MGYMRTFYFFFGLYFALYDKIGEAYAFLMKYAEQNGYEPVGGSHECYIDGIWNKESEEEMSH